VSVTPHANYSAALTTGFKENWLFQFYHGDESAFTGLAFADTTVGSIFYLGAILNQPSIRESIDLESSTAKSSNISLEVANVNFRNDDLSAEIFGTSRYYINHTVKVYSQLNDNATLSNCFQIYEGRLVATTHTDSRIRLEIVSKRPWDFLEVPNAKTTSNGQYIPVVFGAYTPNTVSTLDSVIHEVSMTSNDLHPVPFNQSDAGLAHYVDGISTNTSNAQLHIYEKAFDTFIACLKSATAVATKDGSSLVSVDQQLKRVFKYDATSFEEDVTDGNVTLTNAANAYDNDSATYANINYTETTGGSTTTEVTFLVGFPNPSGAGNLTFEPLIDNDRVVTTNEAVAHDETQIDVAPLPSGVDANKVGVIVGDLIKINEQSTEIMGVTAISRGENAYLNVSRNYGESDAERDEMAAGDWKARNYDDESPIYNSVTKNFAEVTIEVVVNTLTKLTGTDTFGAGKTVVVAEIEGVPNSVIATSGDITSTGTPVAKTTVTRPMGSSMDVFTLKCTFKCGATNIAAEDVGATMNADIRIYETPKTSMRIDDKIPDKLYSGSDGIRASESYTNGASSGAVITNIVDAHAQALNTYSGYDVSDADNIDTLRLAKEGWNLRYWALEPVALPKMLEQMQYEGGFIFRMRGDGTPQYRFIPDSPSTDFTLSQDDLQNVQVSHLSLDNLITKMIINYAKHPAENRYISTQTSTLAAGTLPRTKWNISAKENIKEVNLDMLVADIGSTDFTGARNSGFAEYYNQIVGDIKLQISAVIVNPQFYGMEPGDFLAFTNMMVDPFGESWSGKKFIVTSLNRSMGTLTFTAREV
jgi:hypothetical protein